jgi:N6-adenosine-specific RNA methylase IME4
MEHRRLLRLIKTVSTDQIAVNPEYYALVDRPTSDDYESLKRSIECNQQQVPIDVVKDDALGKYVVLDGHTRFNICKELDLQIKINDHIFESIQDQKIFVLTVNLNRRHLSTHQKVKHGLTLYELIKQKSFNKQKKTFPKKGQKGFQPVSLPNGNDIGSAADFISKNINVKPRTFARHKYIIENGDDELNEQVSKGKKSAAAAERILKKKNAQTKPISLPSGKYDVIEADPPWQYDYQLSGAPEYPTLETEKIIEFKDKDGRPITEAFAKNAVIFLWATRPKLEDGLRVLSGWGFTYKTCLTWEKESEEKPQKGTGHYVISTSELLLIGVKGKPGTPLPEDRPLDIIKAPRGKRHSEKPDIHPMIEKMYPNRMYLELFARTSAENWKCWGNQLETSDNHKTNLDDF